MKSRGAENTMAEKEKILVVDDEPSIRKYLQTLLEVDGFEVTTVPSGKEALERVHEVQASPTPGPYPNWHHSC